MSGTPFARLAELGEQLQGTTKRGELAGLLTRFLVKLDVDEIAPSARMTIGMVFPEWDGRSLNLSWKSTMAVIDELVLASPELRDQVWSEAVDGGEGVRLLLEKARREPPASPGLTILEVYEAFGEIAGVSGRESRTRKETLLGEILRRASAVEAKFVAKIVSQEMRHGVSEGIMLQGIARAGEVKTQLARRANQFWGDLGEVARVALTGGEGALRDATVRVFRPVKPMLAQTPDGLEEVLDRLGGHIALEYKLDGARVQIHRCGEEVRIYSRKLSDVTSSLPDIADEVRRRLGAEEAILDGEAVAVDEQGRPLPFQQLVRRFRRKHNIAATVAEVPVQLHLFDALFLDGSSLVDAPNSQRWSALEKAAPGLDLVERLIPKGMEEATAFAEAAYREGHEGVMAKDLRGAYTPGGRGKQWFKIKQVMSLDLVIVAADWGYGRRHGWLSNYHLAAVEAETGEYRTVGKTYKGLKDAEFQVMTDRLLGLERARHRGTVVVQPQVVVEVLFNKIQASSQYPSGLALRFARIARVRDDKCSSDADSLETIRGLFEQQFRYKGRPA